ncbi:MAG: hypothetical protein D3924_00550 [Candidatus Electrothrix sp. AR4]|nr:hypothetical protein [Candidatus Electrothrix sp. AR4]
MLDEKDIEMKKIIEARKQKIDIDAAWEILRSAKKLIVGRGKKLQVFDPAQDDKETILKACLGRTGNLRAPTLKINDQVLVGFNETMYEQFVA